MAKKAQAIPKGYHTVTPSLFVAGPRRLSRRPDPDPEQTYPVGELVEVEHYGAEAEVAPGDVAGEQAGEKNGPEEASENQPE